MATACSLLLIPMHTLAQDRTEAGVLACEQVGARINLIIHSTADIRCEFTDSAGNVENYMGETGVGLGIDLQWKHEEQMAFTVLAAISADAGDSCSDRQVCWRWCLRRAGRWSWGGRPGGGQLGSILAPAYRDIG